VAVPETDLNKFKKVSLELMDIGLYYGQQGVEQIRHHPLYQKVDAVVNIDDKFDIVKEQGFRLYTYLDQAFTPILEKVIFLYDSTTETITTYIHVITNKH
jgi:hypothetical protein